MDGFEARPEAKKPVRRESIFRIMNEHDRSAVSCNQISQKADGALRRIGTQLDTNRDQQREFFNARRKIAQAACNVAQKHKIGLEMVDDDSDDERSNFFSGISTSQSSSFRIRKQSSQSSNTKLNRSTEQIVDVAS